MNKSEQSPSLPMVRYKQLERYEINDVIIKVDPYSIFCGEGYHLLYKFTWKSIEFTHLQEYLYNELSPLLLWYEVR